MRSTRSAIDVVYRTMRRDYAIERTRPVPFLFDLIAVVGGCALFYYLGHFASARGTALFAFAVAGLSIVRLNVSMVRITQGVNEGLSSGTLELTLSSPRASPTVVIAESAFELVRGAAFAATTIVVSVTVFAAPASAAPAGIAAIVVGLVLGTVAFLGLATLTAAALLVVRQAGALTSLGTVAMPLICGAYFPISRLPQPLEALSAVLPFRAAVDLIRHGMLTGRFMYSAAFTLAVTTAALLGVSFLAFDRAVRRERRASTLGFA